MPEEFENAALFLRFGLPSTLKPRPNDRNMPTQHVATLLGATCCVRLATLLRHVATCWVLLAQIWPVSNLSQQQPTFATCSNTVAKRTQHVAPNNVVICCVGMLRSFGRGLIRHEHGAFRKRSLKKKTEEFENAGFLFPYGRKTFLTWRASPRRWTHDNYLISLPGPSFPESQI